MTAAPIAYLTCEIKGRDLDGRSLIAAHLVKLGYAVVLGQYWNLKDNASTAPRGCYLFKTSNKIQADGMGICKMPGHAIVASDEEALSWSEDLAASTTDAQTFQFCDRFLALNAAHKRSLHRAFAKSADKVLVAGTARADLLRCAEYECPNERPYVLFNTSFGLLNSVWGDVQKGIEVYAAGMRWDLNLPEPKAIMKARLDYEQASLRETRALLDWLAPRTDVEIIVRPHPSENASWWRKHYGAHGGARIVESSDALPWMQHAKLMIHSDSTTGVEAAVMSTPTVNLSPLDAWANRLVLRRINYSVASAEGAHDAIEALLTTNTGPIADAAFNDPFPLDCAAASARAIASLLPPPGPVLPFEWRATPRTDVQTKKFTVSLEEFSASLARAFEIANHPTFRVRELTDSVVLVEP